MTQPESWGVQRNPSELQSRKWGFPSTWRDPWSFPPSTEQCGERAATHRVRRTGWISWEVCKGDCGPAQRWFRMPWSPSHRRCLHSLGQFSPRAFAERLCEKSVAGQEGWERPPKKQIHRGWWRPGTGEKESNPSEKAATLRSCRSTGERQTACHLLLCPPLWGKAIRQLLGRAGTLTETLWAFLGPQWDPGGCIWLTGGQKS